MFWSVIRRVQFRSKQRVQVICGCVFKPRIHIIPIRDNAMLNGILQGQHTSLALGFISYVTVLLVHADHDPWHLGPADNARENCSRSIIACKACLAHATAVVNDQSCNLQKVDRCWWAFTIFLTGHPMKIDSDENTHHGDDSMGDALTSGNSWYQDWHI